MSRSIDTLVNHFSFLKHAPSTILDKLSTFGVVRTFEPNTRIYWKGDSCTHIAFIFLISYETQPTSYGEAIRNW